MLPAPRVDCHQSRRFRRAERDIPRPRGLQFPSGARSDAPQRRTHIGDDQVIDQHIPHGSTTAAPRRRALGQTILKRANSSLQQRLTGRLKELLSLVHRPKLFLST
jgi:hypothetical protein